MKKNEFNFFYKRIIEYNEIDMQGIVFNSNYLSFFDSAINMYMISCGFDFIKVSKRKNLDFHVVKVIIEFIRPLKYKDNIDIGVKIVKIGISSIKWKLGLFLKKRNEIFTIAEIIWVYTNQITHKPFPITIYRKKQLKKLTIDNVWYYIKILIIKILNFCN